MAEKSGCPIVPIGMNHNSEIFEDHFPKVKRANVSIEFGEPIYVKELDKEKKKFLGAYTREVITEIVKKNENLYLQSR